MSATTTADVQCYAVGLVCISACAPGEMPVEEVEREVNGQHFTGLDHGWSKSDDSFKDGEANPCVCNTDPSRKHWLFNC